MSSFRHARRDALRRVRSPLFVLIGMAAVGATASSARAAMTRQAADGDRLLELRVGAIDTTRLPNLLDSGAVDAAKRYVLQLDGPMSPARAAGLREIGVTVGEYLPRNAFVVRLDNAALPRLRGVSFALWLGSFDAGWKLDPELGQIVPLTEARAALQASGLEQVVVVLFSEEDLVPVIADLSDRGATVLGAERVGPQWMIDAVLAPADAAELVESPAVQFIERAPEATYRNDSNAWILQSDVLNQTPVWSHGLHGEGQIAGLIDGTIRESHCAFDDSVAVGPGHRKIVAMRNATSPDFHGTHTAGTIAGDSGVRGVASQNDGLAFAAKLSFSNMDAVYAMPSTLYARLVDAHNDGARLHSNSWGDDSTTAYTTWCRQIDQFTWDHEDNVVAFAITNLPSLKTPENSTNVLAVGASDDAPDESDFCSGGSGPTNDGRRKPEVYAPGCGTVSADYNSSCGVRSLTGTSMACPAVVGAGVLARQYFTDGLYPSGVATPEDEFVPSGALLRAVLIDSSVNMTGIAGYPSNLEGWGRVKLDDALYFAGDDRGLYVEDVRNADGLSTGQSAAFTFFVADASQPLRVTMAYTQPPAAVNVFNPVINNIDLEVLAPGGGLYRGNVFGGGQSALGGVADSKNCVEQVHLLTPAAGEYNVMIQGTAVNQGPQGFALVVTGALGEPPCDVAGDVTGDCHVDLADLSELLAAFGACSGDAGFNAAADFDASGCIDLADLATLLMNFGQ